MKASLPRILVTGGAGYIGSVLTRRLLRAGYPVRIADVFLFGDHSLQAFAGLEGLEVFRGDLRDPSFTRNAVEGMEVVIHLAAIVGDPACNRFSQLAEETNTIASQHLFREAQSAGVGHFIFSSTCSNYGVMEDDSALLDENAPLKPVSAYARQKTGFESFLLDHQRGPTATTILRFATAFGISHRMRFDLTVNHFTRDLALGKPLLVFGKDLWRPYCHTEDLAEVVIKVMQAGPDKMNKKVFNAGSSRENYSKESIVRLISKWISPEKVSYSENPSPDPRNYRVDFSRISDELSFHAAKTVADGVEEVYKLVTSGIIPDPFDPRFQNA